MSRYPLLAALTLPFVFFTTSTHATQDPASAAAKGRITPLSVQVTYPLPAPQKTQMTAKVSALIDHVLRTPALKDPRGFSLTRSLKIDEPIKGYGWHPARGEVVMIAQDIDLSANPKPDANGAYMGRLEGPSLHIGINNLMALYANVFSDRDANDFLTLPLMRVSQQGYPVFRVGLRDVVLIAKPGKLPYVPVSKAEYLQSLLDAEAKSQAEFGPPTNPRAKAYQEKLFATKASLTAEDGAAPACASSRLSQVFGDCSEADASFYVRLNTDYFERGQGAGSVQMITIEVPVEGRDGHKRLEPRLRDAAGALDLDAIAALLD